MDERWVAYVYFFNLQKDYFECHEYGESLWLDNGRPVALKGMIQAAVCLYHLENGNIKGGYAMWLRAKQYLQSVLPVFMGIDVEQLIERINSVFIRVPIDWRNKIITSQDVVALDLPNVQLHVVDQDLAQRVANYSHHE